MKGLFVVFEGIDGSGKGTQIELLKEWFQTLGLVKKVVFTREPWNPGLRKLLFGGMLDGHQSLYCFVADRLLHLTKVIVPALRRGKIVISDRYWWSTIAYQAGQGVPIGLCNTLAEKSISIGDTQILPDLTILLKASAELLQPRLIEAGKTTCYDQKGVLFQKGVATNYYWLARGKCDSIAKIDAMLAPEEIHNEVVDLILPLIEKRLGIQI